MPTVNIAWSYTSDPLVLAALKEFRVYGVDPSTHIRQSGPIIVSPANIPTMTLPLTVVMSGYGAQVIEVLPVDLQGSEGATTFAPVHIALPPVTSVAQVTA